MRRAIPERMRHLAAAVAALVVTMRCVSAHAGAISTIAPELARVTKTALGETATRPIVIAAPLVSDVPMTHADELTARIAAQIASALGAVARPQVMTLAVARAAAKRAPLVFVQPEILRGKLRATVDVYPAIANAWDRLREPDPSPRAHAFAEAPLDAETRAFMPSIPLEQASIHKAKLTEDDVLAAACGDVDGDDGNELVLVSRARVSVGKLKAGAFVASSSAKWSALGPRSPSPLREPIAGAELVTKDDAARVLVGTSDRAPVALRADLTPIARLRGMPLAASNGASCARIDPNAEAFEGATFACEGDASTAISPPVTPYDAFAEFDPISANGLVRSPLIAARGLDAKLVLSWGEKKATIENAGIAVALADLDQDGAPEIITTNDRGDDAIAIATWTDTGLRSRLQFPAPAGVRALAICPPEERGVPVLVAIVGSEVWVVR